MKIVKLVEFTPGPWKRKVTRYARENGTIFEHARIDAGREGWVDDKYMSVSGCISENDAKLIQAAPRLAGALYSLVASLGRTKHGDYIVACDSVPLSVVLDVLADISEQEHAAE